MPTAKDKPGTTWVNVATEGRSRRYRYEPIEEARLEVEETHPEKAVLAAVRKYARLWKFRRRFFPVDDHKIVAQANAWGYDGAWMNYDGFVLFTGLGPTRNEPDPVYAYWMPEHKAAAEAAKRGNKETTNGDNTMKTSKETREKPERPAKARSAKSATMYFTAQDVVVTDPCYLVRDELWDELCKKRLSCATVRPQRLEIGGVKMVLADTIYGDWMCALEGKRAGEDHDFGKFTADAGMVCVATFGEASPGEVLANFPKHCYTVIPAFTGGVTITHRGGECVVSGSGRSEGRDVSFTSRQIA